MPVVITVTTNCIKLNLIFNRKQDIHVYDIDKLYRYLEGFTETAAVNAGVVVTLTPFVSFANESWQCGL